MKLSIILITNRYEPHVEWTLDSLFSQARFDDKIEVIIVAPDYCTLRGLERPNVRHHPPKPTIWSGPHRITKADWWSAASQRNTGICLATGDWVAFLDDRSVLLPGWLDCVNQAMQEQYCVCGTYQKVHDLVVDNGCVKSFKEIKSKFGIPERDSRIEYAERYWITHGMKPPFECPGEWTYGCSLALPLEWVLRVGGFDETCDGLSFEDSPFGLMLQNNNFPIYFDPRMKIIEDRTPGQCEPIALRRDKGVSPNDKSHALLKKLKDLKHVLLPPDLRGIRAMVQAGKSFPAPTTPATDWYDGQQINQFE